MNRLNCSARNCAHNEGGLCGAGYILVEGVGSTTSSDTFCSNFIEGNANNDNMVTNNTNYLSQLTDMFYSMENIRVNPDVSCHAVNCFYNLAGRCEAREITVTGDRVAQKEETACETFISR